MATDMSESAGVTEQAKRLHFAETLLHVSRTVSAMETLDTYGHLWPDSDDETRNAVDQVLGGLVALG